MEGKEIYMLLVLALLSPGNALTHLTNDNREQS